MRVPGHCVGEGRGQSSLGNGGFARRPFLWWWADIVPSGCWGQAAVSTVFYDSDLLLLQIKKQPRVFAEIPMLGCHFNVSSGGHTSRLITESDDRTQQKSDPHRLGPAPGEELKCTQAGLTFCGPPPPSARCSDDPSHSWHGGEQGRPLPRSPACRRGRNSS